MMLFVACAFLASLLAAPASAVVGQASGDTYEFGTGQVLSWTGGWEIDPESTTAEDGLEIVLLTQSLSFMAVMSVPPGLDVDSTRDAFLDGFLGAGDGSITIDRGSYGAVSYSLDTIVYDGIAMGAFTLFRTSASGGETFAWIFVSLVDTFANEFAVAQADFTLDGDPPFTGIEGQGLQDQLQAAVAEGEVPDEGTDQSTPDEGASEETPDSSNGGGGGLKGGNVSATSVPEDPTPEDGGTTPETDDSGTPGETGLIDDSTFVSPAYGTSIAWDANFELNANRDPNPSASTNGVEWLGLASTEEGTPIFVSVTMSPTENTAMDFAEVWSSADYLADNASSEDAEVVLVEGTDDLAGVVYLDYLDDGTELVFYYVFEVDAATSTLTMTEYYTVSDLVEDTLPVAQAGVTVNGEEALTFFTVVEILEAAGL